MTCVLFMGDNKKSSAMYSLLNGPLLYLEAPPPIRSHTQRSGGGWGGITHTHTHTVQQHVTSTLPVRGSIVTTFITVAVYLLRIFATRIADVVSNKSFTVVPLDLRQATVSPVSLRQFQLIVYRVQPPYKNMAYTR